ncbi:MAG: type I restriction enzyme HsdR N-terminal domain-containing protein [Myxococcales bacterium]|nr:type I restriction enzyme HsdR N-terminal domain-containing protein [Myxococcales bacterium]
MEFNLKLSTHADQIRGRIEYIRGEEATKQALVVPLLQVLGYDVFDPREVRPEYTSDFAKKKAGQFEKVDYAIYTDGKPTMFIECKSVGTTLDDHDGQLARYFNATPSVRVAMITDGVRVRLYCDLQAPNIMDPSPWLDVNLLELKPAQAEALRRIAKSEFMPEAVVSVAEEMVYYNALWEFMSQQLHEPSEAFVRFAASQIPGVGRMTGRVVERVTPVLRKVIHAVVLEHVKRSLEQPAPAPMPTPTPTQAPATQVATTSTATANAGTQHSSVAEDTSEGRKGVVTTAEEIEACELVTRWVRRAFPDAPCVGRDSQSWFAMHQANVRKWFTRFNVQNPPYWVAFRHVKPDELRMVSGPLTPAEGGSHGDSIVPITSIADFVQLRSAFVWAYEREQARAADKSSE